MAVENLLQIPESRFLWEIGDIALHLSRQRKVQTLVDLRDLDTRMPSTREEMDRDWHHATVVIAACLITASLRPSDLEPACYPRIEGVWLSEVKESIAYFSWENNREASGFWSGSHTRLDHYYAACADIRKLLVERKSKDRLESFRHISDYIRGRYLNEFLRLNGELSDQLVAAKAMRLSSYAPPFPNVQATEYCRKFYENLIPAVEDNDREACTAVLQALQHGGTFPGFPDIINCFEAAIAVSFLDPALVQDLWKTAPNVGRDTTF